MKRAAFKSLACLLAVFLALPAALQNSFAAKPSQSAPAFSSDELDQMLAPIALYPDPLLAQILPAASFADQIAEAHALLNGQVNENLIESQTWDPSVKAIAHYPAILNLLTQQPDWAAAIGQAYVTQRPDVERSIQRLRANAEANGALQSTPQQQVIAEPDVIRIEPAQPEYIYVPVYDPTAVWSYYPDTYATGLITFGTGLAIGSWLNRDWDWHGHGPYYHGWTGGGWIGASRRFVNVNNRAYVNDHFRNIDVNHNVVNRNIAGFRSRLDSNPPIVRTKPTPGAPAPGTIEPSRRGPGAARVPGARESARPVTPPGTAPPAPAAPPQVREKPAPPTPVAPAPPPHAPPRAAPAPPQAPPHPAAPPPPPQVREKPMPPLPAPVAPPPLPPAPPRAAPAPPPAPPHPVAPPPPPQVREKPMPPPPAPVAPAPPPPAPPRAAPAPPPAPPPHQVAPPPPPQVREKPVPPPPAPVAPAPPPPAPPRAAPAPPPAPPPHQVAPPPPHPSAPPPQGGGKQR